MKILKKVSDQVVTGMKIDSKIARPEGLVLESILIPPNCNRIPEKPGVSQWKFGSVSYFLLNRLFCLYVYEEMIDFSDMLMVKIRKYILVH